MNNSRFFSRSFFVAFFFMPHFLQAQEVKVLSLKEAIELGLENSKFLKVSDAAIKEAEAKVTESRMHQLPDFKVSAAYMRMNTPSVDLKIPLGGQGGSDSIAKGGSSFEVNQMMYAMANASLPLFSGF